MPACAALLEPRGLEHAAKNLRLMLKISCTDCLCLSPAISAQLTLKMCVTAPHTDAQNFVMIN